MSVSASGPSANLTLVAWPASLSGGRLGGCAPGQAKITQGYKLPALFVIHTVGPVWRGGKCGEAEILANCYANSLRTAAENSLKTIAFPAISCGAYGYPVAAAAEVAVKATRCFLANDQTIDTVTFVVVSAEMADIYNALLADS